MRASAAHDQASAGATDSRGGMSDGRQSGATDTDIINLDSDTDGHQPSNPSSMRVDATVEAAAGGELEGRVAAATKTTGSEGGAKGAVVRTLDEEPCEHWSPPRQSSLQVRAEHLSIHERARYSTTCVKSNIRVPG